MAKFHRLTRVKARQRPQQIYITSTAFVILAAAGLTNGSNATFAASPSLVIQAVGAENEYANVLSQIGGKYVKVSSILNNPNTDPHTYEASTSVARAVSHAQLVVQNGLGYDGFMNNMESASPNSARKIIVVQQVLGFPNDTPNPHLWYNPTTMPIVAKAMAKDLGLLAPTYKAYFQTRLTAFLTSLQPWLHAIAAFKSAHPNTPVAVTEPVADYLLAAMGMNIKTPFIFQADIMNGVDPSPQNITFEQNLLKKHQVKVFCYNQQVVSSFTGSIRTTATSAKVPVVGVYETMPTRGYNYQTWMLAETNAINLAVANGTSTLHL